jgi:hypothetical protein
MLMHREKISAREDGKFYYFFRRITAVVSFLSRLVLFEFSLL